MGSEIANDKLLQGDGMTDYRLTYFDLDGGRAEPIRIALHAAGIPFEDNRISIQEFIDTRERLPFHCVPVLEIDGQPVTQSTGIARYVGSMAGLYPTDELQALYCDEAMGAIEDMTQHLGRTIRLEGEEQRKAREALAEGWFPVYLRGLEKLLQRGGGEYFADGQLTMADLFVYVMTSWLQSGFLDHIPTDLVEKSAPALVEHHSRVSSDPRVIAYYNSRN